MAETFHFQIKFLAQRIYFWCHGRRFSKHGVKTYLTAERSQDRPHDLPPLTIDMRTRKNVGELRGDIGAIIDRY